jgi:hypothetical protein
MQYDTAFWALPRTCTYGCRIIILSPPYQSWILLTVVFFRFVLVGFDHVDGAFCRFFGREIGSGRDGEGCIPHDVCPPDAYNSPEKINNNSAVFFFRKYATIKLTVEKNHPSRSLIPDLLFLFFR